MSLADASARWTVNCITPRRSAMSGCGSGVRPRGGEPLGARLTDASRRGCDVQLDFLASASLSSSVLLTSTLKELRSNVRSYRWASCFFSASALSTPAPAGPSALPVESLVAHGDVYYESSAYSVVYRSGTWVTGSSTGGAPCLELTTQGTLQIGSPELGVDTLFLEVGALLLL